MDTPEVLVVGAGGIGKLFAACLAGAGASVIVKEAGPFAQEMKRNGILLKVADREIRPQVDVVSSFDEVVPGRPRLVVFCTKAYDLDSALRELRDAKIPVWATVTPLNGLDIEEKVAEYFPEAEIVASSVTFPVEQEGAGVARITNPHGGIAFAPFSQKTTANTLHLLERAVAGQGFEAVLCPDHRGMRWSKLLLNIIANATGAILDMRAGEIYANRFSSLVERAMIREFFSVAKALGISFVELPEYSLAKLRLIGLMAAPLVPLIAFQKIFGARVGRARGDKRASFDLDLNVLRRTRTEVEFYNGGIARAAREAGLLAPCNEKLTTTLEKIAVDAGLREGYRNNPERLYRETQSR